MVNPSSLTVVIKNKERILFSGQAQAITSVNDKGPFDILCQHENFISLIKEKIIIHITLQEKKEIQIESGIVRAYNDKVFAYVSLKS
jgi:F0F1-type ATP synthase epsilon subunit